MREATILKLQAEMNEMDRLAEERGFNYMGESGRWERANARLNGLTRDEARVARQERTARQSEAARAREAAGQARYNLAAR